MPSVFERGRSGSSVFDRNRRGKSVFGTKKTDDLAADVAELETLNQETGARPVDQDSPGLFRRVVDVLSRPNYAIAGAVEEAFTERGKKTKETALQRAGREFFSGVGSLKGDKEGFGQVMEQSGVGAGGSLSDLVPGAFSKTGKGLALERGGALDITGRGLAGFALDVALDPLTYLTAGTAKGIRIAGATIPGTQRMLRASAEATKSTIKAVPAFDKALDAVGGVFNRDWKIRNLPGAIRLKQAHLNRENFEKAKAYEALENSAIAAIPKHKRAAFVDAMDDGTWAAKYADDAPMRQAAEEWAAMNRGLAAREVEAALLDPASVKQNYAAHFYENSPEELEKAVYLWKGKKINRATLGRHAEMREFETLKAAEEWSKRANAIDPAVPILRPLRNPMKIMQKRIDASVEALEFQKYYDEIRNVYGKADLPFTPDDYFDLTKAVPVSADEAAKIDAAINGTVKTEVVPTTYKYAPLKADSPVSGTFYHGTKAPIRSASELDPGQYANVAGLYGPGLYLTDSPIVATGYSRTRSGAAPGSVLRVNVAGGRLIDLDAPASDAFKKIVDANGATVDEYTALSGNASGKDVVQNLRAAMRESGYTSSEAVDVFQNLHVSLKENGVDGFLHKGGGLVGKGDPHNVVILFEGYGAGAPLSDIISHGGLHADEVRHTRVDASGSEKLSTFNALSSAGKKEFVRNRLLRAKEPAEITNILNKYGVENAPKQKRLVNTLADDGTPYVSVNIPRLKDVEIPRSLADDLADMSESVIKSRELDHLLRYYDRANNTFKTFVTVMFPAFHFRNAYSNLSQGFADVGVSVLNPARHYDAIASMKGWDGALTTKTGEVIPYSALKQEMQEQGVLTTGRRMLEYTGEQGLDRLSTVGGKIKASPRKVGQAIENEARAALYTVYRRRGMDAASAGERVNQFLFDYANLSRVEQDFFRRMIPFYTWTRKNLERQFRNITTKPGYTATQIKAFRGRDDENGMLTSWDAEALKLRLNRDGKTLRVLSGIDLPVRNLDVIWNGTLRSTTRQALGMLSPLLKAPIELGAGASLFTGRDMDRATSNALGRVVESLDPPKGVKDWLGYSKRMDAAGRPRYEFDGERFYILFQSWALSRVVSTTDRQFRRLAEDDAWGPVILDVLTGLRDRTMNLDEEGQKKLQERYRMLQDRAVQRGSRARYENVYESKKSPRSLE